MGPATSDRDALIGRLLGGRYRIEEAIARGGMATVYRASDLRLERPVAVKVLAAPYADDPDFSERFLAEARIAASLSHQNLAHVYDSGRDDGLSFMVLELLDRHRSVRSVLREKGRLAPEHAVRVGLDVLAGLEPLHANGLVHCDVKPGNVMIGADGTKLIDFGIARPLDRPMRGPSSIGSLHAMSPEQLRGERLTPSSDLFAVGVLLYECLTGRVPVPGGSPDEVADAQQRGQPIAPSALADGIVALLDDVVLQALRADPARRFESAAAMATALRSAAEAQGAAGAPSGDDETTAVHAVIPARAPAPAPSPAPAGSRGRKGPARALAFLAAVAVPLVVLAIVLLGSNDANGGGGPGATPSRDASATPVAEETLAPGMVRVPNTIGMSEAQAEAAARAAGLAWRIEWQVVAGQTPGVYAQDPEPGAVVREGSRFVMQAYRSR